MTTLGDLKDEIYAATGGREDTVVQVAAERGINAGLLVATHLFEPPQQITTYDKAINTTGTMTFDELTRAIRINQVYNTTRSKKVHMLEYNLLDVIYQADDADPDIELYAQHGLTLYFRPVPTSSQDIRLWYLQYPERLNDDSDSLPFELHQDLVLALGNIFVQAVLEETENVNMWSSLMTQVGAPEVEPGLIRRLLKGEIPYDYLQRAVSKSTV